MITKSYTNEFPTLDIVVGGNKLFEEGGLRDLLQDPGIMKITHDCRYIDRICL